jgi:hypothetical protein
MPLNLFFAAGTTNPLLSTRQKNYVSTKVGPNGFPSPPTSRRAATSCPTRTGATGPTGPTDPTGFSVSSAPTPQTPFLKEIIQKEKRAVEKLLANAAKISPMADFIVKREEASDAAFETAELNSIPGPSKTLQGFAIFMFFGSYIVLLIILSIYIFTSTYDIFKTGFVVVIFLIGAAILLSLLVRLG